MAKIGGRDPTHGKDEVIAAVNEAESQSESPVVVPKDVKKFLDVGTKTTRDHMNDLVDEGKLFKYETGNGAVYWTSDENSGGEVEISRSINPEDIDPKEVPKEKAHEIAREALPNYTDFNFWIHGFKTGDIVIKVGAFLMGWIFAVIIAEDLGVPYSTVFSNTIPNAIFGGSLVLGVLLFLMGAVIMFIFGVGKELASRGHLPEEPFEDVTFANILERLGISNDED